jgi:hypothetical protein
MQEEPLEGLLLLPKFMNISITLNTEQTAALDELLASHNAGLEAPISAEAYLQTVLLGIINDKVERQFEATANNLVKASKQLPYESRIALIAQVQAAIES